MKVVLATDGTKYSDAATESLGRFTLSSGDQIKVVCVVDMAVPLAVDIYGGYLPETTALENAARDHAAKVVDETTAVLREGFKDVDISSEVLFGSPDSRIVETAEEIGADLIVIGSHGYNRWERLLLGSISNSVVHHAHCSVLIARTPSD
jgi:nucleotide-binding universal stress UspA family protein